jgi:hypothetical protein
METGCHEHRDAQFSAPRHNASQSGYQACDRTEHQCQAQKNERRVRQHSMRKRKRAPAFGVGVEPEEDQHQCRGQADSGNMTTKRRTWTSTSVVDRDPSRSDHTKLRHQLNPLPIAGILIGGRPYSALIRWSPTVWRGSRMQAVIPAPLSRKFWRGLSLTVLHIVWPPEVDLLAHDHLMWAAIGLYGGREDNQLFRSLPDGSLEHRRAKTLHGGDSILLGDDTVHAVANPSRELTGAIHVYAIHVYGGGYFREGRQMWPQPERPAVPFDVEVVRQTLNDAASRAHAGPSHTAPPLH